MISMIIDVIADDRDKEQVRILIEVTDMSGRTPNTHVEYFMTREDSIPTWISIKAKEAYNEYVSKIVAPYP